MKINEACERAARHYDISVEQLRTARGRLPHQVAPRHLAWALIYDGVRLASLNRIGAYFNKRHHTTILYGVRKGRLDPAYKELIK